MNFIEYYKDNLNKEIFPEMLKKEPEIIITHFGPFILECPVGSNTGTIKWNEEELSK
jgi:hypothetical protein